MALDQASRASPVTHRLRLWIEGLEQAIEGQRVFVVDKNLLNDGGELLLDTRRLGSTAVPGPGVIPSPAPLRSEKK
jgi:hypothetical protein